MKKLITAALITLALFSLANCGRNQSAADSNTLGNRAALTNAAIDQAGKVD